MYLNALLRIKLWATKFKKKNEPFANFVNNFVPFKFVFRCMVKYQPFKLNVLILSQTVAMVLHLMMAIEQYPLL